MTKKEMLEKLAFELYDIDMDIEWNIQEYGNCKEEDRLEKYDRRIKRLRSRKMQTQKIAEMFGINRSKLIERSWEIYVQEGVKEGRIL